MTTPATPAERPVAKQHRAHPSQAPTRQCLLDIPPRSGSEARGDLGPKTTVHDARGMTAETFLMVPGTGAETAREMAHLCSLDPQLAHRYIKAAMAALKHRYNQGSTNRVDRDLDCRRAARYAIYKHMNIELDLAGNGVTVDEVPYPPAIIDLLDRDEIFNAAVFGSLSVYGRLMLLPPLLSNPLKEEAAKSSLWEPESQSNCSMRISSGSRDGERVGYPITAVRIWSKEATGNLFLKVCSLQPDIFAASLLAGTGLIAQEMRSVGYHTPDGKQSAYGLIKHIATFPGVALATPIKSIDDGFPAMDFMRAHVCDFGRALGAALEICRLRGIQDRHPANVWVAINADQQIKIAMIDLDLVGCYPYEVEKYQQEQASRLKSIALSLSEMFADHPMSQDGSPRALSILKKSFLEGAAEANSEDKKRESDIFLNFCIQDGYPVGVYCRMGYLMQHFPHSGLGPTTFNPINGPERQQLIMGGGNSGRFIFNAKSAWKHGYLVQRSISPRDFWEPVFQMAAGHPFNSIVY